MISTFNIVRLDLENYLLKIDQILLAYLPDMQNCLNSNLLRFCSFKREPLSQKESLRMKGSFYLQNRPTYAFICVRVILESVLSDVHNKGPIFIRNELKVSNSKRFTSGLPIDIVSEINDSFKIDLSFKDGAEIYKYYDRILGTVYEYSDNLPDSIFKFDYSGINVDLIHLGSIFEYRYKEASNKG